jgi:hypothetical protein
VDELDSNLDRLRRAIGRAVVRSDLGGTGPISPVYSPQIPQSDALSAAGTDGLRAEAEAPHSWTDLLRRWLGR